MFIEMPEYLTVISELIITAQPIKKYMYLYKPKIFPSLFDLSTKQDISAINGIIMGIPSLLLISDLVFLKFFACREQL